MFAMVVDVPVLLGNRQAVLSRKGVTVLATSPYPTYDEFARR